MIPNASKIEKIIIKIDTKTCILWRVTFFINLFPINAPIKAAKEAIINKLKSILFLTLLNRLK